MDAARPRIAEHGGRVVAGLALEPTRTRRRRSAARRDHRRPVHRDKEVARRRFVLEARDLDHALALARLTPIVDGGVEVRPLVGFQVVES